MRRYHIGTFFSLQYINYIYSFIYIPYSIKRSNKLRLKRWTNFPKLCSIKKILKIYQLFLFCAKNVKSQHVAFSKTCYSKYLTCFIRSCVICTFSSYILFVFIRFADEAQTCRVKISTCFVLLSTCYYKLAE